MSNAIEVQGLTCPSLIYGTAWKEERTTSLTALALDAGFRAIDTANQRKHYNEIGVGQGLNHAPVQRQSLFLQTKFTYARGQDHRLPYDPKADVALQVRQSFASSLEHLGTDYVDSYLLHGPEYADGWSANDRLAWKAMEELHSEQKTRLIGVSNVTLTQLETLGEQARIQPAFVQNRCFARNGWDRAIRQYCRQHGVVYQGFSLLTANARELAQPAIAAIANRNGLTVPQLIFRFATSMGMIALTGTSNETHMQQDLRAIAAELTAEDLRVIEGIGR